MNQKKLAQEQEKLAKQVFIPQKNQLKLDEKLKILAFDVKYQQDNALVGAVLKYWKSDLINLFQIETKVEVEYFPSYFCFREGPLLLKALNYLQEKENIKPDLLITDGHGTAHPRALGIASWLGLKANLPSLGCAKSPLIKTPENNLANEIGSLLELRNNNKEIIGYVLRRKQNVKPVYVSAGHLISQKVALKIILEAEGEFRLPDCLRYADQIPKSNYIYLKNEKKAKKNIFLT